MAWYGWLIEGVFCFTPAAIALWGLFVDKSWSGRL